jgi:hypothetical protein
MASVIRIPDELFLKAQAEAARRGVPVEDVVEEALRESLGAGEPYYVDFPIVPRKGSEMLSLEDIRRAQEDEDVYGEDPLRGGTR